MKNELERLRRERGIRQEDLAQAVGVSRQTVISLEKGKYNPSLSLAFRLARYFGLPIEQIFDDSEERIP
ncbi:MAG TPA: helix-turn-helix transcriptional regulator [Candidatus Ventricola intestinavium]|nr:helix-turn-helix transcriptional regulator [Candidatus Ventricola intestinavium]